MVLTGKKRPFTITKHFYWNVCFFCAHFYTGHLTRISRKKNKTPPNCYIFYRKDSFQFFLSQLFLLFFLHQNIFLFFPFFYKEEWSRKVGDISSRSARGRTLFLEHTASSLPSIFPLFYNSTAFFFLPRKRNKSFFFQLLMALDECWRSEEFWHRGQKEK